MKCDACEIGNLEKRTLPLKVEIEGAPSIEVPVDVLKCPNCGEHEIDTVASRERDKKVLEQLVRYYSPRMTSLPGKVAYWMRSVIGLPQIDLAKEARVDPSTLSVATTRNSPLDTFAAVVLLARCVDFLSGNRRGTDLTHQVQNLAALLDAREVIEPHKILAEGRVYRGDRIRVEPVSRGALTKMVNEQKPVVEQDSSFPYFMLTKKPGRRQLKQKSR